MVTLSQWKRDAIWDPNNPYQRQRVYYTQIPGGYSTFYETQVPTTATIKGVSLLGVTDSSWFMTALIGVLALGAGYVGVKYVWPRLRRRK